MAKRGTMFYIPPVIIDEVEDIQREDGLDSRADAFKELAKYARVGREAKRIMSWDFRKKNPKRKKVDEYDMSPIPYSVFGGRR